MERVLIVDLNVHRDNGTVGAALARFGACTSARKIQNPGHLKCHSEQQRTSVKVEAGLILPSPKRSAIVDPEQLAHERSREVPGNLTPD